MSSIEIPDHVAISFFTAQVNGEATGNVFCCRCPVCGDSEKNIHKKRMYLIKKERNWMVYCHNCAYSASLLKFVKEFYPSQYSYVYSQGVKDFLLGENESVKLKRLKKEKVASALKRIIERKAISRLPKNNVQKYIKEHCIPLTDCQKDIFYKRKLDDSFIDNLSFSKDGEYKDRIIIPFLDKDKVPYYFQAMRTKSAQKKYINWTDPTLEVQVERPLYNEHFVDNSKSVYIVEGLIDSVFLNNSVATLGVTLSDAKIKSLTKLYPKRIWVVDNDEAGLKLNKKLFSMKESCFLMPKEFKHIKDINDLVLEIGKLEMTKIVENNIYNSLNGLLELLRK
jgi:hypothetical protein